MHAVLCGDMHIRGSRTCGVEDNSLQLSNIVKNENENILVDERINRQAK